MNASVICMIILLSTIKSSSGQRQQVSRQFKYTSQALTLTKYDIFYFVCVAKLGECYQEIRPSGN